MVENSESEEEDSSAQAIAREGRFQIDNDGTLVRVGDLRQQNSDDAAQENNSQQNTSLNNLGNLQQRNQRDMKLSNVLQPKTGAQRLLIQSNPNHPNPVSQYLTKNAKFQTALTCAPNRGTLFCAASNVNTTILAFPMTSLTGDQSHQPEKLPQTIGGSIQEFRSWEWFHTENLPQDFLSKLCDNFGFLDAYNSEGEAYDRKAVAVSTYTGEGETLGFDNLKLS